LQICEYFAFARNNFAVNSEYSLAAQVGLCRRLLSGSRPELPARESSIRT
jgi:hypothetical protein